MFNQEEKKQIRKKFWEQFKSYSDKRKKKLGNLFKWTMNNTSIKQLKLKFHFDSQIAFAGFEIETRNLDKRIELFDKLEKLKSILEGALPYPLKWDLDTPASGGKTVSRVVAVKTDVNIYNQKCWPDVNQFLFDVMYPIEILFKEYIDFLKY
jgi:hypothetical protein